MRKSRHFTTLLCIASAIMLSVCGCRHKTYRAFRGSAWHTEFNITYCAPQVLDNVIVATMNEVEMSLSPFQHNSLISAINRGETDSVDAAISHVFAGAQHVAQASNGAFDPTISPLINLWGFGYTTPREEPTQEMIDSCLQLVGIADCSIDGGKITKKSPLTEFNLSAITKGYGCDAVANALRENGATDYMVEIGGEMALAGKNPSGEPWRVMIDAPVDSIAGHVRLNVIQVTDCGIATSGNYRNYHDTPSGRIAHTISTVTGRPVATTTLSVTVIATDCMIADAFATACMAMPLVDAKAMIESEGIAALFVYADGDGWGILTTDNFPPLQ